MKCVKCGEEIVSPVCSRCGTNHKNSKIYFVELPNSIQLRVEVGLKQGNTTNKSLPESGSRSQAENGTGGNFSSVSEGTMSKSVPRAEKQAGAENANSSNSTGMSVDSRVNGTGAQNSGSNSARKTPGEGHFNRRNRWSFLIGAATGVLLIAVLIAGMKKFANNQTESIQTNVQNAAPGYDYVEPVQNVAPVQNIVHVVDVGDVITFGSYEQDGNISNGPEELEWLVLNCTSDSGGQILQLITRECIDSGQYNATGESVTWQSCTLRDWLNEDFYFIAFEASEKSDIISMNSYNDSNPEYGTYGGGQTSDKVTLLSLGEAQSCFSSSNSRRAKGTEYAKDAGIYVNTMGKSYSNQQINESGYGYSWWWLRSPGGDEDMAACVVSDGNLNYIGSEVESSDGGIRPVIWIKYTG